MTAPRQKPTIPEVLPLLRAYVTKPENCVGGSLHAVIEDGNYRDCDLEWCVQWAREQGDPDGEALAGLMLRMSRRQRVKLSVVGHFELARPARRARRAAALVAVASDAH